jgi:hypothetical protein
MTYKKKSWQQKMEDKKGLPKILKLKENYPCYNALHKMGVKPGDQVVLVNPSEVIDLMKQVPNGKLVTIVEICKKIAENHGVKGCCSLTTGIFIMTAANAVEEAANEGEELDIPYWRTLKTDGFLNTKYPGGEENQKKHLEEEGHAVNIKGKRYQVANFQEKLFTNGHLQIKQEAK